MRTVVLIVAAALAASPIVNSAMNYPPARRGDHTDTYHGTVVADPYRWMEDSGAADTRVWVEAENALTRRYLDALPARAWFRGRMDKLIRYERFGVPEHRGDYFFYSRNDGLQEQDSLWVTRDPKETGHVLVDPNLFLADGTVSLGEWFPSPDGTVLAYSLSDGGTDWRTWHLRPTGSAITSDLPEVLRGTKFTPIAWARDGAGFWYSRYPQGSDGRFDDRRQPEIFFHRIGTEQGADTRVYAVTDHPSRIPYPRATEDDRYLLITLEDGYETSGLYYRDLAAPAGAVLRLFDDWQGRYEYLGNRGTLFYVYTTRGAPRGRVIAVDLAHPEPAAWRELVSEAKEALEGAALVGSHFILRYISDAHARVAVAGLDGKPVREVPLPGKGEVAGFEGRQDSDETFFSYTDYATPRSIWRYDAASGEAREIRRARVDMDPAAFVTEQVFCLSRDGTRIPIYIVRRRDVPRDGQRPTVLYGYGGFNVSLLPYWSASRAAWLAAGGVYAVANLRGGGEYGEAWHQAGTKLRKQNVFDDYIAAAEYLIREGYTSPKKLAASGGSNGGLLVGAVLNQRPELFAAAVPAVGVMDMLRYQTASANARQWSSDYGLSEVPEEFRALRAYSPYHNIRAGSCYPPTLVLADANDDRVVPWHSYKYAAALQHAQGCGSPVLIRIETRAGHGAGASTSKLIEEYADQWAFLAAALGLEVPAN